MPDFAFSPSLVHKRLVAETGQSLAYDGGDVTAWQRRLRRKLKQLTGWRPPPRDDLNARTLWRRDHALGTIEKIVFTSEKAADAPAYFCIPADARPPYDVFICLQGHSTGMHVSVALDRDDEATPIEVPPGLDFAVGCMKRGIAALCVEQRSCGERSEKVQKKTSPHMCHDAVMQALMLGTTLTAERVLDVDRAIDYLHQRGDVDMRTLGVMGNSGGGVVSMYAAALLPRVRIAMPSCAFCSFAESFMSIYHCADNYIPGILKVVEAGDLMGLAAPKPLVIVAGEKDHIIPVKGVRYEFARTRRVYREAGARNRVHLVVGKEGHRFYAADAWPVALKEVKRLKLTR